MIKSLTRELTIVVKAAPRMIPTARSMTLPRIANSRNSRHMLASPLAAENSMNGSASAPDRYTVVVRGLVLMCSIGIRRAERDRPQRVRVSVELTATVEAGFSGDDRRRVINYEKVVAAIRQIAASGHIDLCEGFAARICDACFADPRVGD